MNKEQREWAWGWISFYTKLFLADLIIFSALVGWIAARYEAGLFGPVYWLACGGVGLSAIIGGGLLWAIIRHFKSLRGKSK